MRAFLLTLILFLTANSFSQDFLTSQLDKYFPNRKSKQIERLQAKTDSLQKANDSLSQSLTIAAEKINKLKDEVLELKEELYKEQQNSKNAHIVLHQELTVLRDSVSRMSYPVVICKEETIAKKGSQDPIIVNTCMWRNYRIVEKGTPDYKGRYVWTTELFRMKGDTAVKISTVDLFKAEKLAELEKMINTRLEEDFKALRETDRECFSRRRYYPNFKMKDMRIAVSDNSEITFEVEYGLSDACFAVNAASTSFKIKELKEFFAE